MHVKREKSTKAVKEGQHPPIPTDQGIAIVSPSTPTGKLSLLAQTARVQTCLHSANDNFLRKIFFRNALPLLPEKKQFIKEALIEAAAEVKDDELKQKIVKDAVYAKVLGSIVRDPLLSEDANHLALIT